MSSCLGLAMAASSWLASSARASTRAAAQPMVLTQRPQRVEDNGDVDGLLDKGALDR